MKYDKTHSTQAFPDWLEDIFLVEGFRSNDTSATHPKNYSNKSETLSPIHEESVDTKKKKSYSFFYGFLFLVTVSLSTFNATA